MASTLPTTLYILTMTVYSLGIYRIYYFKNRFRAQGHTNPRAEQDIYLEMPASYQLWGYILSEMKEIWNTAHDVCILLLPLSIAILQIGVVSETIFARTATISAFLFATMGLVLSHLYTSKKLDLNNRRVIDKWVEASRNPNTVASVEFWVCLALPISCAIWSAGFCMAALAVVAYSSSVGVDAVAGRIGGGSMTTSLAYLSMLFLFKVIKIWRALRVLGGKEL